MTPAVLLLKTKKYQHELLQYTHEPDAESYGLEACEKLNLDPVLVYKTLVCKTDSGELVVAIVPVASKLGLKKLAKAAGVKKVSLAPANEVERSTGYVLGGVSPLGQKKRLRSFIDTTAQNYQTVYVSAGKRGLEVGLSPADLCVLTHAHLADITE